MESKNKKEKQVTKILIVEDSPTQAQELQHLLEENHYVVNWASNGRDAIRRAHENKPAMIISDIVMPEMNGFELCKAIKADGRLKDIPVVLVTSLSGPEDVVRGLQSGAANFIRKPYEEKYIISRINYILANREIRKTEKSQMGIELLLAGERYFVTAERQQILDLLIATYEDAVRLNAELKLSHENLERMVLKRTEALTAEIAERKSAEQKLKENEERYRSLVIATSQMVWSTDPQGLVKSELLDWQEYTGQTRAEILGSGWLKAVHPDDGERVRETWKRAVENHEVYETEFRLRHKAGEYKFFSVRGVPVRGTDGKIREWIGTCTDMTNRRKLEDQLRQSQKMEAVGKLAGGIAHDFNNMLTIISSYAELLLKHTERNDPNYNHLEEIQKAAERSSALTRQLLAFSRKQVFQPKVIDLNFLITNMEKMLGRLISETILLSTNLPEKSLWVKADPGQLEQVIVNLVVNARDAVTPKGGGKISIQTRALSLNQETLHGSQVLKAGDYVVLSVQDTGMGMDEETKVHIFEPFFTTKGEGKGTGLGLATVFGIVHQCLGSIEVESEPGKGAAFNIYLPAARPLREEKAVQSPVSADLRGSETILLVEDERAVRELARNILQMNGYRVFEAHSGEEAVKICQDSAIYIHLLVTDSVMPGISGRDLKRKLMQLRPNMKVLYISGYMDQSGWDAGALESTVAFLAKPFTPESLILKVSEILKKPS